MRKFKEFWIGSNFASGTVLAILFLVLPLTGCSGAVDDATAEFELDLGPQGKEKNRDLYGYGTSKSAREIEAGEWNTWEATYHVGRMGIDDGGRIFLLFHLSMDWGAFQVSDPAGPNYVSARTTGRAKILTIDINKRHAGPRPYWTGLVITVREGDLKMGDKVIVTLGDSSGGGPGIRAPTITSHQDQEFRWMVDPMNAVNAVRVLESPEFRTVAGDVDRLQALWPSEATAGETTWLLVKAKDIWGNPASSYSGRIRIQAPGINGLPSFYQFKAEDQGYHRFENVEVPSNGGFTVRVVDESELQLQATTNLMVVKRNPEKQLFCGDLHGQHLRDSASVEQYAAYARGFGGAEFMSWAKNDFHITEKEWDDVQRASEIFNQDGRFIVFPGYEWSGTTGRGGDHNVIHFDEGGTLYRSGYAEEDLRGYDARTDRYSIDVLLQSLQPEKTFLMPHIGGRRANLEFFDSRFMPFIEIYSDHGQFEWFLREVFDRGLMAGFTASSDDAYGKLGDSIPGDRLFAVHGGITCVYANELTRHSVWSAFKKRRVYGTTGERIQLRFKSEEHWLGEEINASGPVSFSVEVSGTAGIDRIDIFRGIEKVHSYNGVPDNPPDRIKVVWRGAASKERARQTVWQGAVTVSGARIKSFERYRLDYPLEELRLTEDDRIVFDTITAGDEDGVVISIGDHDEDAQLTINGVVRARNQFGEDAGGSRELLFSSRLDDLTNQEIIFDAGGVDRELAVRRFGSDYPRFVQFEWTEPSEEKRSGAYWVRVLQEDGAVAWSSPIFVTR
ncbi:MAG: hypothetical protein CMO98_11485 [Woeseia sp.]|nr:hypothetical protein [Woeseia sp.]